MAVCKQCKYYIKIMCKKYKVIYLKDEKTNTLEKIEMHPGQIYNGCLTGNEKHMDYITGTQTRILMNCEIRNEKGNCKSFIKKRLLWNIL